MRHFRLEPHVMSARYVVPAAIGFAIAANLFPARRAGAAPPPVTFGVDSTADQIDDNLLDDVCHSAAGKCTLRAAVMQANRMLGDVTINLPAGNYSLGAPLGADGDDSGDLNLTAPVSGNPLITVTGAGSATTIIDGNATDGVFTVDAGRTAVIRKVTVRNGNPFGWGGGIHNEGILTLANVVIRDNHVTGARAGGGIYNANQLGIYGSTVASNVSDNGYGGGISNVGDLTIVQSTINHNYSFSGGAVFTTGTAFIISATFSGNHALRDGGGIYNSGISNIYSSTIAYNEADADANAVGVGGGIYNYAGATLNLRNSLVPGNYLAGTQPYDDCAGAIGMYGNNRFSPAVTCTVAAGSPGTAASLDSVYESGILADNGGPTETIALMPPSSLIGGGVACVDQNSVHLAADQRGQPRPPSPANPLNSTCDVGAFEYNEIFPGGFETP